MQALTGARWISEATVWGAGAPGVGINRDESPEFENNRDGAPLNRVIHRLSSGLEVPVE